MTVHCWQTNDHEISIRRFAQEVIIQLDNDKIYDFRSQTNHVSPKTMYKLEDRNAMAEQ